jgi:hypothetical protein
VPPTGGGEDVVAGPLRGGKMCLQLMDGEGRQPDGPPAGVGADEHQCPLAGVDRPAGGPHSAELGRDGEHSWTKAVQQVILRHGDASSQLDLAIST